MMILDDVQQQIEHINTGGPNRQDFVVNSCVPDWYEIPAPKANGTLRVTYGINLIISHVRETYDI